MKKTDRLSPLGEQTLGARKCVTVRLLHVHPIPPSWAVLYSIRQDGGRGSVCGSGGCGKPTGTPQHALSPKDDHNHKVGVRNGCSSTPSPKQSNALYSCMQKTDRGERPTTTKTGREQPPTTTNATNNHRTKGNDDPNKKKKQVRGVA